MHPELPNFLLLITDQQRADHIGAYGNTVVKTPHLDRLSQRGWTADRCYVASPICMPNRASLMTGRLPSLHGTRHNGIPLSLSQQTFVDRLREEGYATALIGKSHLQNISGHPATWPLPGSPVTRGEARKDDGSRYDQEWIPSWRSDPRFDVDLPFYGFEHVRLASGHGDSVEGHYRRWLESEHPAVARMTGFANAWPTPEYELSNVQQAWRTRVPEELSTTSWVADETCKHLATLAKDKRSFFINCSFPDPHHPFTPPGRYWDMYSPESMVLPKSYHAVENAPAHVQWLRQRRDSGQAVKNSPAMFAATEREVKEALALNYGLISQLDDAVGKIVAQLEALGLASNTVVLFTSDHGDFFGDHQLLWKGPLHYQGLTRVPLIWSDPAAQPGRRSPGLCSTIDIAPTILARAGCTPYNGIQGLSLLPEIQDNQRIPRGELLIEEEGQRVQFGFRGRTRMRTLQTDRYRMSVYEEAEWGELYDLQQDPDEMVNLWDHPSAATTRQRLQHDLIKLLIAAADHSPNPTAVA